MQRLLEMMTYRRPHESKGEAAFIKRFLDPYNFIKDNHGNFHLVVGVGSKTLFSAHVDTVHRDDNKQAICYDKELALVYKDDKEPLGADNAAGMWVLLGLIDAGVPGTYIIHRGEEKGGIGSRALAVSSEKFLEGFDRAVAFDRRGEGDVITHQNVGRCCSDKFADALCHELNLGHPTFEYKPDDTGSFTDTASYVRLIPECTNVSVGYDHEHGPNEVLNVEHIVRLLAAAKLVSWEFLPVERDPAVVEQWGRPDWDYGYEDSAGMSWMEIYGLCKDTPLEASRVIEDLQKALAESRADAEALQDEVDYLNQEYYELQGELESLEEIEVEDDELEEYPEPPRAKGGYRTAKKMAKPRQVSILEKGSLVAVHAAPFVSDYEYEYPHDF